jgi:hypothetical protein
MSELDEIAQLKAQVDQLTAENAVLREGGFRGSKAEALMALEYDRIPTFMKNQQAIAWQRKIATAVMIAVPLILVAVAVFGGCMLSGPSAAPEIAERLDRVHSSFQADPAFKTQK